MMKAHKKSEKFVSFIKLAQNRIYSQKKIPKIDLSFVLFLFFFIKD